MVGVLFNDYVKLFEVVLLSLVMSSAVQFFPLLN